MNETQLGRLKRQEEILLQAQARLKMERERDLPHLYGLKMYPWQKAFFDSTNRENFITAANQIGKSTIQIRKCIDWATDTTKWKTLWPRSTPKQFWYFYPDSETAFTEVTTKWIPDFLPRATMKDDPQYGWVVNYKRDGTLKSITFNTGVVVFFKFYTQKISNLQASSVYAVFGDEEMPWSFVPELTARLSAALIKGYFHLVFTATIGQEEWRLTMEPRTNEVEKYPSALKQTVSLYDCKTYHDGTPGPWTDELIEQRIKECSSENEIQRRVFGRFVTEGGRAYQSYSVDRHFIKPKPIPPDWKIYSALDYGAGGTSHPSAVAFIAVRPDYQLGYVFKFWRGDGIETTAGDVIDKWQEMGRGMNITQSWYDWAAKDLATIAYRQGFNICKADKSRESGQGTLNTLFRNDMLFIFDDDEGQGAKLSGEFLSLMEGMNKSKARDDGIDSVRYCSVSIPWDWAAKVKQYKEDEESGKPRPLTAAEELEESIKIRRGEWSAHPPQKTDGWEELENEFEEWNDQYG